MPTLPDLLLAALVAIVGPVLDHAVFWPAHRRLAQADPAWARRWLWASAIGHQWTLVAFVGALWMATGRPWTWLGLGLPAGWRAWAAGAVLALLAAYLAAAAGALARSPDARMRLRGQVGPLDALLPHTPAELCWFGGVSLTAGFCEELLYRGFFVAVLAPSIGWWGAAALSVLLFACGHAYQGLGGAVRTGALGAVYALVVGVLGSLWPAMALHFLWDLGVGTLAWLALREEEQAPTSSRSA